MKTLVQRLCVWYLRKCGFYINTTFFYGDYSTQATQQEKEEKLYREMERIRDYLPR